MLINFTLEAVRNTGASVLKAIVPWHSLDGAVLPRTIIPLYGATESSASDLDWGGELREYLNILAAEEIEFSDFFTRSTGGCVPWGAQKAWLKRLLQGENTVLVAPTGLGKTTLLLTYAIYLAKKGEKTLYVTPTQALLKQVRERLLSYAKNSGVECTILAYDGSLSKRKKMELLEKMGRCEFDILVITNAFLLRNHELLANCPFSVVVVDDVDSLLKSERSARALFRILGYPDDVVELAKKRSEIVWKILVGKAVGRDVEKLVEEYIRIDYELESRLKSLRTKQLVVASATGKTRGDVGRLLRELLRVDVTGISIYGRDVTDSYVLTTSGEIVNKVVSVISRLGKGCIIYVSPFHPYKDILEEAARRIGGELSSRGLVVEEACPRGIAKFVNGEVDVLIGSASYYGSSVRGLDAPKQIRYVVFLGTPVHVVPLENFLANLNNMARVLDGLCDATGIQDYRVLASRIRKKALNLSPSEARLVKLALLGKVQAEVLSQLRRVREVLEEVSVVYEKVLADTQRILEERSAVNMGTVTLVKRSDGKCVAVLPDLMTYIQASGRTSRLIGNVMTHGFSLVVEIASLFNVVRSLEERLKRLGKETGFIELDRVDLESELHHIERSRGEKSQSKLAYKSVLIVVESPTKARTIARFFGRPSSRKIGDVKVYTIPVKLENTIVEFNIAATRGHIYDLTTKDVGVYGILVNETRINPVYTSIRRCRICGAQFVDLESCPRCSSSTFTDSKTVITALQKLALEVDEVYIATDPDIEGEKIAYDVYVSIAPFNSNVKRIELHEITLSELLRAINSPRNVDLGMVEAEIYRRVLDRLVGFSLSNKLKEIFGSNNHGAGRVQSPVLGLIVERYRDYVSNRCKRIVLELGKPVDLKISLCVEKENTQLIELLKNTREVLLVRLGEQVEEVSPKPPYTTDELLAEASRRGFTSRETMKIAQELFESGLITYHRTDCTHVSSHGIGIAREYLASRNLASLFRPSHWGNPGTHEAIRPVHPLDMEGLVRAVEEGLITVPIPLTDKHLRIYDMVFKRFIASQMKPFRAVKAEFAVVVSGVEVARLHVYTDIVEPGFNEVLNIRVHNYLHVTKEVVVPVNSIKVLNSSKVPLYSEGEVVILMKKLGIGRPSTYAKVIENLRKHGYVVSSSISGKLVPTKRGIQAFEYLSKHYPELISVELTRSMEETIDKIARGEITGSDAVLGVIQTLHSFGLLEQKLLSPYLYGNIRSYTPVHFATSN